MVFFEIAKEMVGAEIKNNVMKIFHYTSIETLALILKNKNIRFTRLDMVDDPDEYSLIKDNINPSQYVYVSCWTKNAHENMPQWYMYGNGKHGVRIEMESELFETVENQFCPSYFSRDKIFKQGYMIMPILKRGLLLDIDYVEDVSLLQDKIFVDTGETSGVNFNKVAVSKSKNWQFQQECRFILNVFPCVKSYFGGYLGFKECFENHYIPPMKYIDVPLLETAYQSIKIMLGPDVNEAEETIVKCLMQTYLHRTDFTKSSYSLM